MNKLLLLSLLILASVGGAFAQNNARMLSTPNSQTGTTYTFISADTTRVTTFNNASPVAVTLPNGATVGFGPGNILSVVNVGAGAVTITCSSCTISANGVTAATLVLSQGQGADIYGGYGSPAVNYVALPSPSGTFSNITATNLTVSGTGTFTGLFQCKNFENNFCVDSVNSQGWAGSSIDAWIASAITGCPASGCNIYVYAPAGTITWNSAVGLNKPVTLIGPGPSVTFQIKNALNAPPLQISANNVRVTGFLFDGNRTNQSSGGFGIQFNATVNHVDIDHNQFQNFLLQCIAINNASYVRIQHNRFSNCNSSGNSYAIDYSMNSTPTNETNIFIDHNDIDSSVSQNGGINISTSLATGSIKTLKVDDNNILVGDAGATDTLGIQFFSNGSGGFISGATANNNRIFGNNATNTNTWGMSIGTAGVTHTNIAVAGNSIRDTRKTCIEAIGQALTVTGNNCFDTGGIQVPTNAGAMQGITIAGNALTNGSGILGQQIGISGSASNPISAAAITGNSIYFPALAERCIFLNGNATGQIISANITGNICQGQGATMTQTGIELFITLRSNVSENLIRDFSNGSGAGSLCNQIADAASTGNKEGPNFYFNCTTSLQDNGTSTELFEPFPASTSGNFGVSAGGLKSAVAGGTDVGAAPNPFGNLWLGTAATNNFKFQPATTAAARTITIADPLQATVALPLNIASGSKALNTASITTATCDAGVAATATGTLSTDTVSWSFNVAPTATNKYGAFLVVYAVPSANTVTFYTCNPSATTSTPTAMTVNWSVERP